jgi:Zn-dependent membrane protease YugP
LITSVTAFFAGLLAEVTWLLWIGVVGIGIGALFALLTLLVESRAQRA